MISLSPPTICNSARKTTLRKQPSEKATFISFFSGHKGAEIIPCTGIRKDFGSALALPPITWRTEHDWESGTLTAETIDAGYISIILEI
ncbi:hypothetical protein PQQ12_24465 (plasmid) [Salmonella enterica subsp. enterica serovar Dublin]|uniref:hypothetical protein n=1 Tax=Salmonella enterica TaxID=28901 RepID=UPI00237FEFC7|nr:hypothetical protein [Salmonella enterica]WDX23784.1 hypothetical protein PQQ12_24465 [Salmonella enterica subsp. enterica serovar Dublin]